MCLETQQAKTRKLSPRICICLETGVSTFAFNVINTFLRPSLSPSPSPSTSDARETWVWILKTARRHNRPGDYDMC